MTRATLTAGTLVLLALAGLLGPETALAQRKFGVAFFAPELPFQPARRLAYIRSLAQHLSRALGVPVEGRACQSAREFQTELATGAAQFAVLGAAWVATTGTVRVLATAVPKNARSADWSLMARSKMTLASLTGKVMQLPNLGPITEGMVQYGLVDATLDLRKDFQLRYSPDLGSAIEAVSLNQAQVVFAPVTTEGLTPILRPITLPPPAFVALGGRLTQQTIDDVTRAVVAFSGGGGGDGGGGGGGGGVIGGWTAGGGAKYKHLGGLAKRELRKLVMAQERRTWVNIAEIVDRNVIKLGLPELDSLFEIP